MSLLNKIGLEKLSAYNDLLDMFNMQHAHVLQLESDIISMQDKMAGMSDTPNLRSQLDYMNARYEDMKSSMAKHGA
jgi:hypothetical protein